MAKPLRCLGRMTLKRVIFKYTLNFRDFSFIFNVFIKIDEYTNKKNHTDNMVRVLCLSITLIISLVLSGN